MIRSPLKRVSKKRQAQRHDYEQAKAVVFARDHGACRLGLTMPWCGGPIDPHHIYPTSRYPERRCDPTAMVLACRVHHRHIHENPRWARAAGWLK